MEKLTGARTLNEMAERLAPVFASSSSAPAVAKPLAAPTKTRDVLAELIAIVSDRTGYPPDMLDANAAIEADLGIDSIKRVEVLSAFQRTCSDAEQTQIQLVMEKLTSARTLNEIADRIQTAWGASAPGAPAPTVAEGPVESVARFTLTTVSRPRAGAEKHFPGRVVVITDDENGVAAGLAETLKTAGERVLVARHSIDATLHSEGVYSTDLTSVEQIDIMLATVRAEYGPIGAIIHLLPLQTGTPFAQLDLAGWRAQVRQDVRSLFLLAKAAESDLKRLGKENGALLAAVTARGGEFGLAAKSGECSSQSPTHFAVADFVKTLALEFNEVLCKVVDVDAADPLAVLHTKLAEELCSTDETLQVGLAGDRRLTVIPQVSPLPAAPLHSVDANSVVLLTGGARGITAGIAKTLARKTKPTLILAGASALPPDEPNETAALTEPAQIKAALMKQLKASGKTVKPADVEAAYSRLSKNREILRNLADLRKLGSTVEYHAVDVRDEAAFGKLIDQIYTRLGRLDVVIHGAGLIEDKLIKDKTPESFDRVVHTKTDSSFVLTRALRPSATQCLIFMSSITAAFGNRGQADYAAANGVMNGIATMLATEWPGHIVAMNWGPWDQGGMVSDDVRKQFLAQRIEPIVPAEGDEAVMRELALTTQGNPIAVFGEGPWRQLAMPAPQQPAYTKN
jgi:NAD(P)-dependent dehydrogenase (short-subunit alcohol dehydrogenase family)/acyl carrier protein